MKNIFITLSKKRSILYYDSTLKILPTPYLMKHSVNLYITSDDEINVGDYYFNTKTNKVSKKATNNYLNHFDDMFLKKIIFTTDEELISVKEIPYDFLEWFVQNPNTEYVDLIGLRKEKGYEFLGYEIIIPEENNNKVQEISLEKNKEFVKNTSPEVLNNLMKEFDNIDIETKKSISLEELLSYYRDVTIGDDYKIRLHSIIINAYNNGSNWQAERMYSEEEVNRLLISCKNQFSGGNLEDYHSDSEVVEWFEKNKKKYGKCV